MTPPPRPALHLAEHPPPTPRRTLDEIDAAEKVTAERVDALGSVAAMTAARLDVLTHDHDEEASETVETVRRIEARQLEHGLALEALARGAETAWAEAGLARDEMRAIGSTVADLEAHLVIREAQADRVRREQSTKTARTTAITTTSATGAVVVIVEILKLFLGG